ncbi:DUF2079 domain-containing protein [Hymenobacter aerilatus]|uniref:DUF2079 domain-containing protein n=1 Tax=Hymenobacter aerilatus TaxID=2932251 RepID=A0A8T9SSL1_9BACT|nr:DUF2079 domain-containing protein [Hymenobacter aerilatus]UOR04737.1 DUF2079 domain-containing protein [Hymenobacter aerilatus]
MLSIVQYPANLRRLIYWLLAAELSLFTVMRSEFGYYLSPVLLYATGVVACAATYYYTRHRPWNLSLPQTSVSGRSSWLVIAIVAGLGMWLCATKVQEAIHNYLIQISSSDIIPALSIYTKRFLQHEEVYTPFTQELGYFALPTYLPATWFPYLLPEWLRFDYRWMSSALLAVGIAGYLVVVARLRESAYNTAILASLPFVLTYATIRTEASIFGFTVECMIIGYYFLLLTGILLRSWPLQAVALILCLLSRFSLVVWGPLYFFLLFFQESRQRALLLLGTVAAGILVFYVVPFMSHDWGLFMRVQAAYTDVAVGEWLHLNNQGKPYHLYNGVGLGNFFYRFGTGELVDRIRLLKKVHLVLVVCITLGAGWLYWRQRAPRTDYRVYAILVLKLYLITFYAFIQVPYSYLASVGIFTSLFLVLLVAGTTPPAVAVEGNRT